MVHYPLSDNIRMCVERTVITVVVTTIVLPPVIYPKLPNIIAIIVKNTIASGLSGVFMAVCPKCITDFIIGGVLQRVVPRQIGTGLYIFGMHFAFLAAYMYVTGDTSMSHVPLYRYVLYPVLFNVLGFSMQGTMPQKVANALGTGPLLAKAITTIVLYYVITIAINYYM